MQMVETKVERLVVMTAASKADLLESTKGDW
jgi:hypothetical protein